MLDKIPIKVVAEAKFLGVVSDRTLSYKKSCQLSKEKKVLDILNNYSRTHRLEDRSQNFAVIDL